MWQFWIILSGICFIIEIATVGFLVFWFGIGALIAMVVSFFTPNIALQTASFVISSTLLLFCTRRFANQFSKEVDTIQTNAFSIIGKNGIVIKEINPISGEGQIKVGSEVWSAKSSDGRKIEPSTEVEILKIDGVKVIVK